MINQESSDFHAVLFEDHPFFDVVARNRNAHFRVFFIHVTANPDIEGKGFLHGIHHLSRTRGSPYFERNLPSFFRGPWRQKEIWNVHNMIGVKMGKKYLTHLAESDSVLRHPDGCPAATIEQKFFAASFHQRARLIALQIYGRPAASA